MLVACVFQFSLFAQESEQTVKKEPTPHIFHNFGWNILNSFTYNYGLNFAGAGLGTWGMIETGIDWKWRNTVYDNSWMGNIGGPVMVTGALVPFITPLAFYLSGKYFENEKLIITASALTQTFMITMLIQSPLKMITGRNDPGLVDNNFYERIHEKDDFSNNFNWFNMDFINGWPSGHTANAFSAAATLSEIYHDNIWVKIGAYTYAAIIGFGTTVGSHWASEAVAGALIGYAIGKTVGRSYRKFLENTEEKNHLSFYFTFNSVGVIIRL